MLDGESKFVFMAKEIENMNISMMAEQSICPRPTMVSNVWATKREITCFDVDGNEMLCDEFCEDQYPVIGVPSVRPSVDDLETCVGNLNWSECRSVDMFSEILTPNCSPVPSAGWIEVNGHFTASCCEPGGLIVPWNSRCDRYCIIIPHVYHSHLNIKYIQYDIAFIHAGNAHYHFI